MIAIFTGCSLVKESAREAELKEFVTESYDDELFIRVQIKPDLKGMSQNVDANVYISRLDSIGIEIFGPFGISVGKLYSDENSFMFFNTFENKAYTGTPSADNLKKVSGLDFAFNDLIKVLRLSAPTDVSDFELDESYDNDQNALFASSKGEPEFLLVSKTTGKIVRYQRKNQNDKTVMNIFYRNYKTFKNKNSKNYSKPSEITVQLPQEDGSIKIEVDEYKELQKSVNFGFKVPSNIEVVNVDNK
jgi:hypothetical protein